MAETKHCRGVYITESSRRTELHFVRCIKPNDGQRPSDFQAPLTLHQLRCCGVLEVTRIARAGYPTRYLHRQFAERYHALLHGGQSGAPAGHTSCLDGGWSYSGTMFRVALIVHHFELMKDSPSPPVSLCTHGWPLHSAALHHASAWTMWAMLARHACEAAARTHADMGGGDALEVCKQLLREFRIPPDMYQIGRTKLFFRAGVLGHLEDTSARLNRCGRPRSHAATQECLSTSHMAPHGTADVACIFAGSVVFYCRCLLRCAVRLICFWV